MFIWNFTHKAIKYVAERNTEYKNMRQYQYLMNTLLLIVKSKQLMKVQDIMRMFNANYAIDSWFKIIIKEHDFNYISKHMRCMAYQILIEILRIDAKITREKIMSWTYTVKPFVYDPPQMTEISPNLGGGLDNGYKIFELFFRKSIFPYYY